MHRGVYFDGWFPGQHCYHPSLPPRRLRMVEDLVDLRATVLLWSAMGGGSLALPYLEQEAFGEVPPRERFYGFVNDSEFVSACHEHGIAVFGVVFEAQGWEFPVELDEDESHVLALNELRGAGRRDWLGLREFTSDRYPKLWKPVAHYFPDGLRNSRGEVVTDIIEECVARDIDQQPCHARWVECPDREHQCYYMDRNNPVWREYLKAVIRIQIDAGVDGIQLDEAELPMGAFQYGGCFCRECTDQFRAHLQALPPGHPALGELESLDPGADLVNFHYGRWLKEQGYDFKTRRESTPLFGEYFAFQCAAIKRYFGELAAYAREYARSTGREVLVSGNFFNLDPAYLALADDVDLIITEMRNTTYRQPEWYRYVAAFAGSKEVLVVENPYGGVVPELVQLLRAGRGHDLFRLSLYEGAAFGANMTTPYGAWLGATIQDSYHPPHQVASHVQAFLADHERLLARASWHELAVVFSVASTRELIGRADAGDNLTNERDESVRVPYRVATQALAAACVPFDVLLFPDGQTAADRVRAQDLTRYRTIVLPDCFELTTNQAAALRAALEAGVLLVVTDRFGQLLPERERASLLTHPGLRRADADDVPALTPRGPQLTLPPGAAATLGANLARLSADGAALHLVNYGYDAKVDAMRAHLQLALSVRLPITVGSALYHDPDGGTAPLALTSNGDQHLLTVPRLGVYGIVELRAAGPPQ